MVKNQFYSKKEIAIKKVFEKTCFSLEIDIYQKYIQSQSRNDF